MIPKRSSDPIGTLIDADAEQLLSSTGPVVLRRSLRFGWPLASTVMLGVSGFQAIAAHFSGATGPIAVLLAAATAFSWIVALRRTKPIGSITRDTLQIGERDIPWTEITGIHPHSSGGDLVLTLYGAKTVALPLRGLTLAPGVVMKMVDEHLDLAREARARARVAARPAERAELTPEAEERIERELREAEKQFASFTREYGELERTMSSSTPAGKRMAWLTVTLMVAGSLALLAMAIWPSAQ